MEMLAVRAFKVGEKWASGFIQNLVHDHSEDLRCVFLRLILQVIVCFDAE